MSYLTPAQDKKELKGKIAKREDFLVLIGLKDRKSNRFRTICFKDGIYYLQQLYSLSKYDRITKDEFLYLINNIDCIMNYNKIDEYTLQGIKRVNLEARLERLEGLKS